MQMQASVPMFECLFIMSESAFNKKNPYFNNVETSRNFVDSWTEHLNKGHHQISPRAGGQKPNYCVGGSWAGRGAGRRLSFYQEI